MRTTIKILKIIFLTLIILIALILIVDQVEASPIPLAEEITP